MILGPGLMVRGSTGDSHPRFGVRFSSVKPPNSGRESLSHSNSVRSLKFDPTKESHRLTGKKDDEERSSKRILKRLSDDSIEREMTCVEETDLNILKQNGKENGLADFLARLETRFRRLFF